MLVDSTALHSWRFEFCCKRFSAAFEVQRVTAPNDRFLDQHVSCEVILIREALKLCPFQLDGPDKYTSNDR